MDRPAPRMRSSGSLVGLGLGVVLAVGGPAPAAPQQVGPLVPGLQQRHPLDQRQVGELLLVELRCDACHGALTTGVLPERTAPRLDDVGARVVPEFLERFIADPTAAQPGTTMPDVLSTESPEKRGEIAAAIAAFLRSRSTVPVRREPIDGEDAARGRELFHTVGCLACHGSLDDEAVPDTGVGLAHVRDKYSLQSLTAFLFQPTRIRPSGRMPDMKLTRDEARFIASSLIGVEETPRPSPPPPERLVESGREYFEQYRCAACHALDGVRAPPMLAPPSRREATTGCLAPAPSGVPDYHLTEEQTRAIRAALNAPRTPPSDPARIAFTLTAFNCIACHVRDDYGGVAEALDPYFTTTQPDLGNEARLPARLTLAGAKLRPAWLRRVLFDGVSVRPYMPTRMPQFGEENLADLPGLLERTDRMAPVEIPEPQGDARKVARDAGHLMLGDKGLNCITCHDFNGKPSPGFRGMDLIGTFERLQPAWFVQYLISPQGFRPGTVMPSYWPDHESSLPGVLDGDTRAQIEALWFVLSLGRSAPDPSGIHHRGSRLQVTDTPRTYRGRSGIAGFRGIAVGFPGGLNYAFNAETGALSGLWRGDYLSVRWSGQGAGDFNPAARAVPLAKDLALAWLEDDQSPWPLLPALDPKEPLNPDPLYPRTHGYRFQGYSLDDDRVPTFRYWCVDIEVEDRSVAETTGDRPVLRRTLRFAAPAARILHFRALTGAIEALSAEQFQTADLRLMVPGVGAVTGAGSAGVRAVLRPNTADPSTHELLLAITLPEGASTVRIDYELR